MRISSIACTSMVLLALVFVSPLTTWSQNQSPVKYVSADDQNMTIKSIVIAPVIDNMNKVYASPLTEYLKNKIQSDQQWSLSEFPESLNSISDQLDSSPKNRLLLKQKINTSALLTMKLVKGPKGISIRAMLYSGPNLEPLLQESADQIQSFELDVVKKNVDQLFDRIKKNLPYRATILSRRGAQVTMNIGTQNGLGKSREARAILILHIARHPKLGTMTSAEKEILAKIEIFKIDEYLSFGEIKFEKQPGLVQVGTKVIVDDSIPVTADIQSPVKSESPNDQTVFGEKPKEWLPMSPPQFGSVAVALGIVQYNQNYNLTTVGSTTASNNFGPTIRFLGEMWINDQWFVNLVLKQSAFSVNNGLAGSTPSNLNMTLSQQALSAGHNFLLTEDFFGPKIKINLGFSQFSARADQSTPLALTNMSYGGMYLGFTGSFPISETLPIDMGVQFKYYISKSTNETIASGYVTSTKINDFGFFGKYRRSQNFNYTLDFLTEYYTTDFDSSGASRPDPATAISHKVTNILVGLEYLF